MELLGKEINGLHEAAYLLAIFAFMSQILGLVRDRLFASYFGPSEILDIYYASFRIPDFLFVVVIALVSTSVLIPLIVRHIDANKEEMSRLTDSMFSVLILFSIALSLLIFFGAEWILGKIVPDLVSGTYGKELVVMTQILLFQPIFLSISSLFSSIVQSYKKFAIYALTPIFYNLGIILGIVVLYPMFGIYGLTYGVVLGAIMHLAIQIPFAYSKGALPKFTLNIDWQRVKEVFLLSVPRTIALASGQIVQIIFVSLAATMAIGSISIFNLSYNLQAVPLAIIGVSYSLAAFPTLSKHFSNGDSKKFIDYISKAAKHIIFWSIPVMVLFVVLRAQIVRTILGGGEFSWNDTSLVAAALAVFAVSVVAQSLIVLFVRGYYASGETKKPFIISVISTTITIVLAYVFISLFKTNIDFRLFIENLLRVENIPGTVVLMLPLAYTLGQIIQAIILWSSFDRSFESFSNRLWKTVFHSVSGSIVMGVVAFACLKLFDDFLDINTFWGIFGQGFFAGIIGIFSGIIILVLLNNPEVKVVWKTLHKKIWKTKLIAAESEDIA